jgi:hypothetical protein
MTDPRVALFPARSDEPWPALPLEAWRDTSDTLNLWLQIVGKVRLAQTPWINHSWHATFYVTPRGLTTSAIAHGERTFDIEFDFQRHQLRIDVSDGGSASIALEPQSVAAFYVKVMAALEALGIPVEIYAWPNEVAEAIGFAEDQVHRSYDAESASRFWRALVQADRVLKIFRARFIGKCSPVHFFWGAPDLAVTRFSGRAAPLHPGGVPNLPDWIAREAYSHEVSSCGFWQGSGPIPYAAFYAYAYPEPEGFRNAPVEPRQAFYSDALREFVLPYDAVRLASSPDDVLLAFLGSTYEAAADLGDWDRTALESCVAPGQDAG